MGPELPVGSRQWPVHCPKWPQSGPLGVERARKGSPPSPRDRPWPPCSPAPRPPAAPGAHTSPEGSPRGENLYIWQLFKGRHITERSEWAIVLALYDQFKVCERAKGGPRKGLAGSRARAGARAKGRGRGYGWSPVYCMWLRSGAPEWWICSIYVSPSIYRFARRRALCSQPANQCDHVAGCPACRDVRGLRGEERWGRAHI